MSRKKRAKRKQIVESQISYMDTPGSLTPMQRFSLQANYAQGQEPMMTCREIIERKIEEEFNQTWGKDATEVTKKHCFLTDEQAEVAEITNNMYQQRLLDMEEDRLTAQAAEEAGELGRPSDMGDCIRCKDKNQSLFKIVCYGKPVCLRCCGEIEANISRSAIVDLKGASKGKVAFCCERAQNNLQCLCLEKSHVKPKESEEIFYGFCTKCPTPEGTKMVPLHYYPSEGWLCEACARVRDREDDGNDILDDDNDDLNCKNCGNILCECVCDCFYCGDIDNPGCDCCPSGVHGSFLDDNCDCMTSEEKQERICEQEENLRQRSERMFGFGKEKEVSKGMAVDKAADTVKFTINPEWCSEHKGSTQICVGTIHEWWCIQHNSPKAQCQNSYHFPPGAVTIKGEYGKKEDKTQEQTKMFSSDTTMPPQQQYSAPTGYQVPKPNYTPEPVHSHPPTEALVGKDGAWSVWAGKGRDVEETREGMDLVVNSFDLMINLTGRSVLNDKHIINIPELKKWEQGPISCPEMVLDWPDYGIIEFPLQFWLDLMGYIEKNNKKVVVFCMGGHGRTGTALSAMMMVALDWTAYEAVEWLRKNYCKKAVESKSQIDYLYDLEDALAARQAEKARAEGKPEPEPKPLESIVPSK